MSNANQELAYPQITRDRIDSTRILKKLHGHILDGDPMKTSQVNAAIALLKKTIPDLSAIALTGADGKGPATLYVIAGDIRTEMAAHAQATRGQLVAEQPSTAHHAVRRLTVGEDLHSLQSNGVESNQVCEPALHSEISVGSHQSISGNGHLPEDDVPMLSGD